MSKNAESNYAKLFPKAMALEHAFVKAGGMLIAGTDPDRLRRGDPGLLEPAPGRAAGRGRVHAARGDPDRHAQRREIPGTRRRIGSIAVGKAGRPGRDAGDPAENIADIRLVETVFKQGVGFDPAKLIESVKGRVGLW